MLIQYALSTVSQTASVAFHGL